MFEIKSEEKIQFKNYKIIDNFEDFFKIKITFRFKSITKTNFLSCDYYRKTKKYYFKIDSEIIEDEFCGSFYYNIDPKYWKVNSCEIKNGEILLSFIKRKKFRKIKKENILSIVGYKCINNNLLPDYKILNILIDDIILNDKFKLNIEDEFEDYTIKGIYTESEYIRQIKPIIKDLKLNFIIKDYGTLKNNIDLTIEKSRRQKCRNVYLKLIREGKLTSKELLK